MKKNLFFFIIMAILALVSAAAFADDVSQPGAEKHLAGWYVSFNEEGQAVLNRGIISIRDGMISEIQDYREDADDVIYLAEDCVIFPGLIDLHAHLTYHNIQLVDFQANVDAPWDNRFQWRPSKENQMIEAQKNVIISKWMEPYSAPDVLTGDLITYFLELQAAVGGTTMFQNGSQLDGVWDQEDFIERVGLIRSTGKAEHLGADRPTKSITQIFLPDVVISADDPQSYLPPMDTSAWGIKYVNDRVTQQPLIEYILDSISQKTEDAYLIHLAEGRAGNLRNGTDAYSRLEFETLKNALTRGVENGDFTIQDVRDAHINLIHGCAIDLDAEEDYKFISEYGIGLHWSLVSNLLLYEDTPNFYDFLSDPNIVMGIGSDWSPSGSKTVWDECKFAYNFAPLNAEDLLRASTLTPARMIKNKKAGNIHQGGFADFFILKGMDQADIASALDLFITAEDSAVEGVVVAGTGIYGERDLLESLAQGVYSQYAETPEALGTKYFRIPDMFGETTLQQLSEDYNAIIQEADATFSEIRTSEDDLYLQEIENLKDEFAISNN